MYILFLLETQNKRRFPAKKKKKQIAVPSLCDVQTTINVSPLSNVQNAIMWPEGQLSQLSKL